jgi:hypothetical protein
MMGKHNCISLAVSLSLIALASSGWAQTASVRPTTTFPPNNSLPRVIFPLLPVAGQPWQACYQNPAACTFPGGTPTTHLEIVAGPTSIDLKTLWKFIAFSPCPDTNYKTANMPAVAQAGPITIRLFQRSADLPLDPFVQTFEQVIQVQAPGVSSFAVPALDWRASLALCGLIIGVMASRRR